MNVKLSSFLISIVVLFGLLGVSHEEQLSLDYYNSTCPQALDIVREVTWRHVAQNFSLAAPLLRLHFQDCFVRGCDASVLLDSTANNKAQKDALPNLTLGGFHIIGYIKAAVEEACPGVVSFADIVALAARDSVSDQYKTSLWNVPLGKRDGTISLASEALENLRLPTFNFDQLKQNFTSKGLDVHDLVVLSGAHTIGVSHCTSFSARLYNFMGKGDQDSSLNPFYATYLKTKCQNLTDYKTTVPMDPISSLSFDTRSYQTLVEKEGLFQSDAALLTDENSLKEIKNLLFMDYFLENLLSL